MQAAQIIQPKSTRVMDAPLPKPGPDEVLIQVHAAGICGTDIHILHGTFAANLPLIPGHEFSGEVAAVGANVTRYQARDRVTADPNIACGRCYFCQRNEPNQCLNHQAIGVTKDGGFAEYVLAPQDVVFPIGDMSYEEAALIEPLACVVWGLKQVNIQPGDSALIFGAGPMGSLVAQAVKGAGAARVVVTDVVPHRLQMVGDLGATETIVADDQQAKLLRDLEPYGFDIVVDATGIPSVMQAGFNHVKPRGKIWVFGVAPEDGRIEISPFEVFRRDLTIVGSFAVNRTFPQAIAMIQHGAIQVKPLISHQLPLADFDRALELAQTDPNRMKVQFSI